MNIRGRSSLPIAPRLAARALLLACALAASVGSASTPGSGHLFDAVRAQQKAFLGAVQKEQVRLTDDLQGLATTGASAGDAVLRDEVGRVEALLDQVPRAVRANPQLFEAYTRTLGRVEAARDHARSLLATQQDRPAAPEALDRALSALSQSLDALLNSTPDLEEGLVRIWGDLKRPSALVVSGGVSLGAYQAGVLYYYTEALKSSAALLREKGARVPDGRFQIAAGASAGSINAFLAAMSGCLPSEPKPEASLFYRTWVNVGMTAGPGGAGGLYDLDQISPTHLLNTAPLDAAVDALRKRWIQGGAEWAHGCGFSFGAPVTALEPRRIPVRVGFLPGNSGGITLPLATEHFLLDVDQQDGLPPDPISQKPRYAEITRFRRIPDPLLKSGLFPKLGAGDDISFDHVAQLLRASSAFPIAFPPVTLSFAAEQPGSTALRQLEKDFVDGGMFDNNPLGIAILMDRWAEKSGTSKFLFVNSSALAFGRCGGEPCQKAARGPATDLATTYAPLLNSAVEVAEDSQLFAAVSTNPELSKRIEMPLRRTEVAGEHLASFSSFLEKDFRIFDFYRGMVDARAHYLAHTESLLTSLGLTGVEPPIESEVFRCFVRFDPVRDDPACKGEVMGGNLRALLLATERPFAGEPSTYLTQFDQRLRKAGYHFANAELEGGWSIPHVVRTYAGLAAERLATKQQHFYSSKLTEVVSEIALDASVESFAAEAYWVWGIGSQGVELSRSIPLMAREMVDVRLSPGLRFSPFQSQLVGPYTTWEMTTFAPFIDLEFDLHLNARLLMGVVGIGPVFEGSVIWPDIFQPLAYSRRQGVEVPIGVTVFKRLELRVRPTFYLGDVKVRQRYAPYASSPGWFALNASFGYRW